MKRITLIVVLLALVVAFSFSLPWSVGLKAGVPFAWAFGADWDDAVDVLDDGESVSDIGLFLGASTALEFSRNFGAQLDAMWGIYQWGLEGTVSTTGESYEGAARLDLLEVPLMIKVLLPAGPGRFTLLAGPMMQYATGAVVIAPTVDGEEQDDVGDDPDNLLVFGVTGGVGYEFLFRSTYLAVETRYNRTLTSLFDDADWREDLPADFDEFYLHAVEFYLGFGVRTGGA